jgi:NDP-sugar pyrophosphorylase family protein
MIAPRRSSAERSVSPDGRLTAPARQRGQCLAALDVLVIAGGLGTRIQSALGDTPKLLAPIGGRPYLAYLLDWLRRFGARRIVLGLGHRAQAVTDFLERNKSHHDDLQVVTVIEPQPLGTAGAVRLARAHLRSDPVLVMNGDSFVDADLCALVAHHDRAGAKATLLCAEVDDAGRYGRVMIDGAGRIAGFVEKDPNFHGMSPVSAGVYLFSAVLLDEIAAGDAASLERDVFGRALSGSLAAYAGRFTFIDIGTPESLKLAASVFAATFAPGPA